MKSKSKQNFSNAMAPWLLLVALAVFLLVALLMFLSRENMRLAPQAKEGKKYAVAVPRVSISSPQSGTFVYGSELPVELSFSNVSLSSIGKVELYKDNALYLSSELYPFELFWDTTEDSDEVHTIYVKAYTYWGEMITAAPVAIQVDNQLPWITLTSPSHNDKISGTAVMLAAEAGDNYKVKKVVFYLPGVVGGIADDKAPYSVPWDTTSTLDGSYRIHAAAFDYTNLGTRSQEITVLVANNVEDSVVPIGKIVSPASGSKIIPGVPTTITVEASDNMRVNRVEFFNDAINDCVDYVGDAADSAKKNYTCNWKPQVADSDGRYLIQTKTYDDKGNYMMDVVEVYAPGSF